jgi:hypothetical protein
MTVPTYVDPLGYNEQRIIVPQNNDVTLTFNIVDPNDGNSPVDITGASITMYIKQTRFYADTDQTTYVIDGTVTNGPAGQCEVVVPGADNATACVIWYRLDVTSGGNTQTAQYGPYEVIAV